jgi:uncharacterized protein YndB with AHSA1/START domain
MEVDIEQSIEVAVPPARAWELVSTSEGLSSWFVESVVVPGPSGSVTLRFAPGAEGTMPIQRWEPPRRIRFGAAEGAPGRAHDLRVMEMVGGGARVHLIDSGLDEGEAEASREGWAGFLSQLKRRAETG